MKWTFKRRFLRHAFGWRSQPATRRIKEAVSEIKRVARGDALLAAEGAVSYTMKAAEQVGQGEGTLQQVRGLVASDASAAGFVTRILGPRLGTA